MNQMHVDLARMAADGSAPPLVGRPVTDQNTIADFSFYANRGITRQDLAERDRHWARQDAEDKILAEYRGEIPGGIVADTRGLRGSRCEWARYVAWKARTAAELADLKSTKARLGDIVSAATQTEGLIAAAVRRTTSVPTWQGCDRRYRRRRGFRVAKKARERARHSQAAAQAMPEIEAQIEAKKKQLAELEKREPEFLHPAMAEIFEESGIGRAYARKQAEVAALKDVIDRFTGNFTGFYTPSLNSLHDAKPVDLGWKHSWREIAKELRADPRLEPAKLLPKLKA